MIFPIKREPESGLLIISIEIDSKFELKMVLDTGATNTTIDSNALYLLGYDLKDNIGLVEIETANGIIETEVFEIGSFSTLGQIKKNFQILKLKLQIEHEELKFIYKEIIQLKNTCPNILNLIRNILVYLGMVILKKDNMLVLRNMVYEFGNIIQFVDKNNYFLTEKTREFLSKIITIINHYESLTKLTFKLNNRLIILKNYK